MTNLYLSIVIYVAKYTGKSIRR